LFFLWILIFQWWEFDSLGTCVDLVSSESRGVELRCGTFSEHVFPPPSTLANATTRAAFSRRINPLLALSITAGELSSRVNSVAHTSREKKNIFKIFSSEKKRKGKWYTPVVE
jgi:hypothetical protein